MARVDNLTNFLTDVANSIRGKKGTTDPISASSFDTEISSIQSGGSSTNDYFYETPNTWVNIDDFSVFVPFQFLIKKIPDFEIPSSVTTCAGLFNTNYYPNNSLLSIGKITNTASIISTAEMFYGLSVLQSVDLSAFSTTTVTDMHSMFNKCSAITNLDLSNFDTANTTNMSDMFDQCSSLNNLNISNFDFTNVTNYNSMFGESDSDAKVPADCYILVKDATAKEWITSKFDWLTNIHYVGETE